MVIVCDKDRFTHTQRNKIAEEERKDLPNCLNVQVIGSNTVKAPEDNSYLAIFHIVTDACL